MAYQDHGRRRYGLIGLSASEMFSGKPSPEPLGFPTATQEEMIEEIRQRVGEGPVLEAFKVVDRADFVPPPYLKHAYARAGIPLSERAVMSFPTTVARTTTLLDLDWKDRVLEIGTGSGYGAALLSRLAHEVHSVEIDRELAASAEARLKALGFSDVETYMGDGANGLPRLQPFDAILVTAGLREAPQVLIDQLAPGGRMVVPIGDPDKGQMLTRFTRDSVGALSIEPINTVFFQPIQEVEGS